MQESVRRIIEAEESRMGKSSHILATGQSENNVFKAGLGSVAPEWFFLRFRLKALSPAFSEIQQHEENAKNDTVLEISEV